MRNKSLAKKITLLGILLYNYGQQVNLHQTAAKSSVFSLLVFIEN